MGFVFSGSISNEFEGLAHTILRHFLFCFAQFLELACQNFEGLANGRVFF
jgi:hypothetical protein